jgi:hypothetical protein
MNWIDDHVAVGNWVDATFANRLIQEGVELIVDARALFARDPPLFRPVPMIDKIVALAGLQAKVLIRCRWGRDRTPFVAMVYVSKRYGLSHRDAYERVRKNRPITVFHWDWVEMLERRQGGVG